LNDIESGVADIANITPRAAVPITTRTPMIAFLDPV